MSLLSVSASAPVQPCQMESSPLVGAASCAELDASPPRPIAIPSSTMVTMRSHGRFAMFVSCDVPGFPPGIALLAEGHIALALAARYTESQPNARDVAERYVNSAYRTSPIPIAPSRVVWSGACGGRAAPFADRVGRIGERVAHDTRAIETDGS